MPSYDGGVHALVAKDSRMTTRKMNWNNMTYSAYDLGNFLVWETNTFVRNYGRTIDEQDDVNSKHEA